MASSFSLASFLLCSISATLLSITSFSPRIFSLSRSFASISFCTASFRDRKCSSLLLAERICSFSTLICPSNFPRSIPVSVSVSLAASISSSSWAMVLSICSYSSLVFSYCSEVLERSSLAISNFPWTSCSSLCSLSFSKRNIFTSSVFSSSLFFR